ncbi:MAG TPA: SDR family oxidoreductase [Streptosporangiales bacterium]
MTTGSTEDLDAAERTHPFAGRTALVTGAGRGIGRAVALQLADAGARVVLVARTEAQLAGTSSEIAGREGDATAVRADLADHAQVRRLAADVLAEHGRIDILVNNAATVAPLGPSVGVDLDQYAAQLQLNVLAVATLTFALLPPMLDVGWGRVVNVSSGIAADPAGMIGGNAYATTKAALEAHTVNLAAELDGTGVTVNAFWPGTVDTAMQTWIRDQDPDRIGAALHQRFSAYLSEGRLIAPERAASTLLTHLTGNATGQVWS